MAMQPQKRTNSGSSRTTHNTSSKSNVGTPVRRQSGSQKRHKNSFLGPVLILFLLTVVLALILAAAWQKFQDAEQSSATSDPLNENLTFSSERGSNTSPASIPSVGMIASSSSGLSESSSETASSEEIPQSGSSDGASSGEASSSTNSTSAATGQTTAKYGTPVTESEKVSSSYFDDALFIGDSITSGIESYGIMSNATVIANTGINPSTMLTSAVWETESGEYITLLDAAAKVDAGKIYVMIGANGIAWIGENTFIDYYAQIVRRLKEDHPNAVIYVQSILPVTKAKSDEGPAMSNGKIDIYNQRILEMTEELGVYYLNVAEAIKDSSGALPSEASPKDGIHFGTPTYQKWFDYLMSHTVGSK